MAKTLPRNADVAEQLDLLSTSSSWRGGRLPAAGLSSRRFARTGAVWSCRGAGPRGQSKGPAGIARRSRQDRRDRQRGEIRALTKHKPRCASRGDRGLRGSPVRPEDGAEDLAGAWRDHARRPEGGREGRGACGCPWDRREARGADRQGALGASERRRRSEGRCSATGYRRSRRSSPCSGSIRRRWRSPRR